MNQHAHIHHDLVETARSLSVELAERMAATGPLAFPAREARGLGVFLARAVIGQQLSVKAARGIWRRIEEAAHAQGSELLAFLTEEQALTLRACGVSGQKIKALLALNAAQARGHFCLTTLQALAPEARTIHLCQIHGIGPWTGDMATLFYFQEPDIWPARDAAVRNTFRRFLREGQIIEEAAARFAPYRSFLALHLWRLVDGVS